jgi:hypothetical protein
MLAHPPNGGRVTVNYRTKTIALEQIAGASSYIDVCLTTFSVPLCAASSSWRN